VTAAAEVVILPAEPVADPELLAALADSDAVKAAAYPGRLAAATQRLDARAGDVLVGSVFVEVPTGEAEQRWALHVGPGCREVAGLFTRRGWTGHGIATRLALAAAETIRRAGHQPVMVISATSGRMNAITDRLGGQRRATFQAGGITLLPVVFPPYPSAR
jgi:GNAT superfamily N-acetyltransferase